MSPTSAPVPVDHHDWNEYDPEALPSFRRPYHYNDIEVPINCERLSISDPPDISDPINSEENDAEIRWCPRCFTGFGSTEALLEHRRTSALHITCEFCERVEDFANEEELWQHCCGHHFACWYREGATFCANVCKSAADLDRHFRIDHFSCRFCIYVQLFATLEDLKDHYRASHITCPRCPDPLVFRYKEELREHCLREHFGCPCCDSVTWSEDEESLRTHIGLEHFPCCFCISQTVFASREDLLAHRRTAHGCFDCLLCKPQQPRIIWPAPWREHMEQCYYPNPCTDDFHQDGFDMISYCDLCEKTFKPQYRLIHLLFNHFCQDCARYGTIFKMHKEKHLSECSRQDASAGPPWWHRQEQQQQNDPARESFRRQHEDFKTRANEQRAPPSASHPHSHPPPPTQKPQEPEPLDIYTILKISPQSPPEVMKQAVRVRRVETHPDKRKRQGLSQGEEDWIDEEAKLVGWAADILLDPEKRKKHGEQVHAWKMRYEQ